MSQRADRLVPYLIWLVVAVSLLLIAARACTSG